MCVSDHDIGEGVGQQILHGEVGCRPGAHGITKVESPREDIAVAKAMIDFDHPLIVVDARSIGVDQIQRLARKVGRRPQDALQLRCRPVHHAGRDLVVGHGVSHQRPVRQLACSERIEERIGRIALDVP